MTAVTPSDVARWMLEETQREGLLYQNIAVYEIAEKFGEEFVYENSNGNLAISPAVLTTFRELSEATVVWNRAERMWRIRESYDEPGRRQQS